MADIAILDGYTINPGDLNWNEIENLGTVKVYDWTEPEEVVLRLKGVKAAFTNKVKINAAHMEELSELRYIGIMATGVDGVDLNKAKELEIVVTNVPEYANYSVSQLTFSLLLELCHDVYNHSQSVVQEKIWSKQKYNSYWLKPLIGLNGKTMGIIGMGKIGERVAAIAKEFGMHVMAYDVVPRDLAYVEWVSLEDLLRNSDVVSIHCPLVEATRGIINKNTLALMKKTAFFINTSRGQLVVEDDLANALNNEKIAGAGLDVLGEEPPLPDNPLLKAKNVVITPHIGWATFEARSRLVTEVALNYKAMLNGNNRNVVNLK